MKFPGQEIQSDCGFPLVLCSLGILEISSGEKFVADLTAGGSFAKKLCVFSHLILGLAQ